MTSKPQECSLPANVFPNRTEGELEGGPVGGIITKYSGRPIPFRTSHTVDRVTDVPKFLILAAEHAGALPLTDPLSKEWVSCTTVEQARHIIHEDHLAGILVTDPASQPGQQLVRGLDVLSGYPDGLVLLDDSLRVLWRNELLCAMLGLDPEKTDYTFYELFGTLDIQDQQACPFETCRVTGKPFTSTLRIGDKQYFEVRVARIRLGSEEARNQFVAVIRNTTSSTIQQQKLSAIYQAGLDLGDLSPQEMVELTVDERIELLKQKILHYTQDLLEFETVEIRLIEKSSRQLRPLLAMGMEKVAAERQLFADPKDNGVTGFVAASGKSYLCDDTTLDPIYLPGAPGAKSSMTVPLILHDEVLGTFNVESPRPHAFDEHDLQFLELFGREVSIALNTLDLLAIEKASTVSESTQKILQEVANPVDEILNDTAWILEKYIGHEPNVADRLQQILRHTRDIKQRIQQVGETITPEGAHTLFKAKHDRPRLRNKRILVVDSDESVRRAAHELLGRYGCHVETAHNGDEACLMVKSSHYDAVIVDIRLTDMTGFDCFCKLRDINEQISVILMTGFGYDPTHSIVKARQMGLASVLYKPFRIDQLLTEVENAIPPTDSMRV
ncbi:MAG: response regulator [Planctomycetaceae bacterium]